MIQIFVDNISYFAKLMYGEVFVFEVKNPKEIGWSNYRGTIERDYISAEEVIELLKSKKQESK